MMADKTYIYRITHIDNLPSIIARGGEFSPNQMAAQALEKKSISHDTIMDRRQQTPVPCGAGGTVADYVPFYFGPCSPMLFAIHKGNVANCDARQEDIVYLVSAAEPIAESACSFVFTNGHAIMAWTRFFTDLTDLKEVDLPLMKERYWSDTPEDPNRKWRRQAEFLVRDHFPWTGVGAIATFDKAAETRVEMLISEAQHQPQIAVKRNWYF
ncbi:MAG: DUF4433 domain-containing protein [Verrucomicrobia bacterium]|nr:DUF4433 domain-containing protein [Verrucomicrobiota bacterium]